MNATEPRKLAAGLCTGEALFRKARPAPTTVSADREGKRQVLHLFGCVCLPFMQSQCEAGSRLPHNRLHCKNRSAARSAPRSSNARPTQKTPPNALPGIWLFWRGMSDRFLQKTSRKPATFLFFRKCFLFLPCTGRIFGV